MLELFYKLRFETAIRELGFDHLSFSENFRVAAVTVGKSVQATPSESALLLVAQLPRTGLAPLREDVLIQWVRKNKLRLERPDVSEALTSMELYREILRAKMSEA